MEPNDAMGKSRIHGILMHAIICCYSIFGILVCLGDRKRESKKRTATYLQQKPVVWIEGCVHTSAHCVVLQL